MADQKPQSKENHTRIHPPFHYFFLPAILLLLVIGIYEMVHAPGLVSAAQFLLIFVVGLGGLLGRANAVKVQDRVIRLEERLRLSTVLPSRLFAASEGLSERQLVALRFASDEELPALAERARTERLEPKAIKALIQKWRPDYWRV